MLETVSSPSPARAAEIVRTRAFRLIALAAVIAGLIRMPYIWTGLSTDEGGYAYVVQQWSHGARIYDAAWLDRPQGLLLTYRALLGIDDSGWTIRLGVVLAGMILTVAIAGIAWLLAGRGAGLIAAFVYAVAGLMPRLEGITLNGELLASVPATVSIALAAYWWRRRDASAAARPGGLLWLVGAGLLAGVALTMKQSGIDGFVVGVVIVSLAGFRWRALAAYLGGFVAPVLACVLHGFAVGWSKYWTALLGYQLNALGGEAANSTTRWHDFSVYAGSVAMDLGLLAVVAAVGLRFATRDARWVLGAWLVAAFIGINLGGSYWPHYYIQAVPPLVILAAITVAAIRPAVWRACAAAVLVLPTLVWMAVAAFRPNLVPYHSLAARDDRVAAYVDRTTSPSDQIYVLESEAYLYFAANRVTSYPYLWGKPIQKIADALPKMRAMFASPNRPELVIMDIRDAHSVDPSGGVTDDLSRYYHYDTTVDGVVILRANR
jgi:4-amino-4-deoxy-L-arabinose transferase-like glycosyltransferase